MTASLETRVYQMWFYAGATAAAFMVAMVPLLWNSWPAWLLILFLQLPAYMVHQVEEYDRDKFRLTLNQELAGGRDALTPGFALLVNLGGVWMVDLTTLYLAYFVRPGLGLIAIYLAIINAIVHIVMGLAQRSYNPGLLTAILVLLPAGSVGWWVLNQTHRTDAWDHLVGLGVAVGIHVFIAVHIFRRVRILKPSRVI